MSAGAPGLMISTPCYSGLLGVNHFKSTLCMAPYLQKDGVEATTQTVAQESPIPGVRDCIVAGLLGRTDYTHLLFADAEIDFVGNLAVRPVRLLSAKKPVVCAARPTKMYDWWKKHETARRRHGIG